MCALLHSFIHLSSDSKTQGGAHTPTHSGKQAIMIIIATEEKEGRKKEGRHIARIRKKILYGCVKEMLWR